MAKNFERVKAIALKSAATMPQLTQLAELIRDKKTSKERAATLAHELYAIGFAQGWTGAEKALSDTYDDDEE